MEIYRKAETWKTSFTVLFCLIVVISQAGLVWSRAPLLKVEDSDKRISGQYIVVLTDSARPSKVLRRLDTRSQGNVRSTYKNVINGFAGKFDESAINELLDSDDVKYVAEDSIVTATEAPPSWGLDRIDERNLTLDNAMPTFLGDGTDVHIYVADTGVRYTHEEFSWRTGLGYNAVPDGNSYDQDCNGHGTHCAGTAAGSRFGVAKNATVHSLRVLGCDGREEWSYAIEALDWVSTNAERLAVVSMSLGGPQNQATEDAVANLINEYDIAISVADGNDADHACFQSPANTPSALTIGSTEIDDGVSYFSNYGSCVDIFAPGGIILSASYASDTGNTTLSGTSMACPHVSGAVAILLGLGNTLNATEVGNVLLRGSTTGKIDHFYAPDRLLYIGQETCMLRCGSPEDGGKPCQCDDGCEGRGDCCSDYSYVCEEEEPTCRNRCDSASDASYPCQCDAECESRQDCCPDHGTVCSELACKDRCGGNYNEAKPCQCNDDCVLYDDCCWDKLVYCPAERSCFDTSWTTEGVIDSNPALANYTNNMTCRHDIRAPKGHVVYLSIDNFDVLEGDGLTIYDGEDENAPVLVDYLSGYLEEYLLIQSTGRLVHLVFKTDGAGTAIGFTIPFYFSRDCDTRVTSPGLISSPNYPDNYNDNDRCLTHIDAGKGRQVLLSILDMDIEDFFGYGFVCYDSLAIFDSDKSQLIELCGTTPLSPIQSSGSCLTLYFISDTGVSRKGYQISDCDAKLADLPGNGRHKRVFILDAEKNDKKTLYPGHKLEIQFVAKVWKRLRGVKYDARLYAHC